MWIYFIILSTALFALTNLVDKFMLEKKLSNRFVMLSFFGFVLFPIFLLMMYFRNTPIDFSIWTLRAILNGLVWCISMTFYYKAIKIEEVTRVVPLIFTKPIFVLIAATFLLGEVFTPLNYFGIASILIGSFIISIKKQEGKRKHTKAILPVIIAVLGWAFMDLNGKSVLSVITDPFVFTAYILFGISIFSFLMWIFNLRDIKEAITEGYYKYLFINPLLISISFSLYMTALSLAPASFVAATNSIQSLFVLIYAIVLSRYLPSFIREGMDKRTITIKLLSIILIILGVYIIS